MCFTVNVNIVKEELEKRYGRELIDHDKYRPSYYYHAFSLPYLPVVTAASMRMMQWGLIPSWTEDSTRAAEIRIKTFNARAETIAERPAFAESYSSRRCVVPVTGFYEYQHKGAERLPWFIYSASGQILPLGGLWNEWTDPQGNVLHTTFTIVTTAANSLMAGIHNSGKRMPLILPDDSTDTWLFGEPGAVASVMKPAEDEVLKAHTIGPLIKSRSAEKNSPDIIKPYDYYITGTLFDGIP